MGVGYGVGSQLHLNGTADHCSCFNRTETQMLRHVLAEAGCHNERSTCRALLPETFLVNHHFTVLCFSRRLAF